MIQTRITVFFAGILLLLLSACTTSIIKANNPQFADANEKDFALVYLMRPTPIRTRGVADNDIKVEFGENQLVSELSAGEYVAFKVKPGKIDIITRSIAFVTARTLPEKVWRARNFDFKTGQTYYILTKFTQEEFRGMYFIPEEISLKEAQAMLIRIKPAGLLAKQKPII
ncbi:MAG: DUF2846 domain-containing protein [Gammaproteobacteria bacterium]|nr:DUF2846 domain-containing protein [Gammaproteobacteria bacterium]